MLLADKLDLQNKLKLNMLQVARTCCLFAEVHRDSSRLSCRSITRRPTALASQIEERELNYYTQNALTVGTQAALLAGFAFTGIIEAPWDLLRRDYQAEMPGVFNEEQPPQAIISLTVFSIHTMGASTIG